MKKIITIVGMVFIVPLSVFAHGNDEPMVANQLADDKSMMETRLNHEEMESLMKKFMVNGQLSETDADLMLAHINELLSMGMEKDAMMPGGHSGSGMMSSDDMEAGMMGGNMMAMNFLHGLVGVTSLVWLVAGVMYLRGGRRREQHKPV